MFKLCRLNKLSVVVGAALDGPITPNTTGGGLSVVDGENTYHRTTGLHQAQAAITAWVPASFKRPQARYRHRRLPAPVIVFERNGRASNLRPRHCGVLAGRPNTASVIAPLLWHRLWPLPLVCRRHSRCRRFFALPLIPPYSSINFQAGRVNTV
jgi:hypothetical protein